MADKTSINPFNWHFADDQGVLVTAPSSWLFVSGQTAMSDDGEPQHPGDLRAQVELTLANVHRVLEAAGMTLSDVVQLNTHVTDVAAFQAGAGEVLDRAFAAASVSPPGVLSQVSALGHPDLLVEIDAIAVR
ncbi:RidA family protein [Ruania alkalisoli]|uniref:RidA family protein n=1 Tax=Ruania alkalisoli TaxID=2779775 RepID=A0A7M1SVL8_9MICO|nr:RidA family protein [Ruania alkalisoli]QOR70802.1 RidA family protein [Ruania alkalisoli]